MINNDVDAFAYVNNRRIYFGFGNNMANNLDRTLGKETQAGGEDYLFR